MAAYLVALDCFEDARVHASRALAAARDVKATVLTACILQHFVAVGILDRSTDARRAAARERAAMLLGFVDARFAALGARREYTEQQEYDRITRALQDSFEKRLADLIALGAEWNEDGAVAVALEL
jgi:hypothetical protein